MPQIAAFHDPGPQRLKDISDIEEKNAEFSKKGIASFVGST
jgi:hypothetical protein